MKKAVSLLLTGLMAFSAVSAGAVSASAATEEPAAIAFEAGSKIFFDNTNTNWNQVYFYSWNYGYFGDSVPMTQEGESEIYSVVVPVDVPAYDAAGNPTEYFLFKSAEDWSGSQTANQTVEAGMNTYTPSADCSTVTKSNTEYTPTTEVAITPYSKSFTGSIDVTVYAFNTNGAKAEYQINNDAPVTFTEPTTIKLTDTATVKVTAGTASTECTFTKIPDAEITVKAYNEDGSEYTGSMYVYTYGGDRVAPGFDIMQNLGGGTYTYTLNGSAHVIFTTTNDWTDAVKFIIGDPETDDQEPFVASGSSVVYDLTYPETVQV